MMKKIGNNIINKLFIDIKKNNGFYTGAQKGGEFEDKIKSKLKSFGFAEIVQISKTKSSIEDIASLEEISKEESKKHFDKIKKKILSKNSIEIIENPFSKIYNNFIFQPYGSQNFPDFLIISKENIIAIEVKFSTNSKKLGNKIHGCRPMWNSNIPKSNAIYIYGVSGEKVTYFKGSDILCSSTRKILIDYFEKLNNHLPDLDDKLKDLENKFGLYPYIRKAYEHKANKSTFIKGGKKAVQSYFSEEHVNREKNVLEFLSQIK